MPASDPIEDMVHKGLVKKGNDPDLVVQRLPLGIPAIDDMLGGGLPKGRCTQCYGPESTGKTLLAQIASVAVQGSDKPDILFMDLEHTYDQVWWKTTGVNTDKLMVSSPYTGEQAIDIMRSVLDGLPTLGMIIVDSIPRLVPAIEMNLERTNEDNNFQPGAQARLVTHMYHQLCPMVNEKKVIFLSTNQMRENINNGYDELNSLPGGKENRHANHIILRTARESWINEGNDAKKHKGFYMRITQKKNKLAATPDGSEIHLPFLFSGQIDMLTHYLEEALSRSIISKRGPYYGWNGANYLGMQNLRQFFLDNPNEQLLLQSMVQVE